MKLNKSVIPLILLSLSVSHTLNSQSFIYPVNKSSTSEVHDQLDQAQKNSSQDHETSSFSSEKRKSSQKPPKKKKNSPYLSFNKLNPAFESKNFEWNPYDLGEIEGLNQKRLLPKKSLYFHSDIGFGFLYFRGAKATLLANLQSFSAPPSALASNYGIRRSMTSNPTPFYEYMIGRRFTRWFNAGLAYQYQGGVTVQTQKLEYTPSPSSQFISNFSFNSILAKCQFEFPIAVPMGNLLLAPYLGLGGGVVWQTWTRSHVNIQFLGNVFRGDTYFRPTYCASSQATADLGFRLQINPPYIPLTFRFGCKFNYLGQARNIGKFNKQGAFKLGLAKPVSIKSVYQWAPYLSLEWNFSPIWKSSSPYHIGCYPANRWAPFFSWNRYFDPPKNMWTQFNVGLGSLEFKKARGLFQGGENDLITSPVQVSSAFTSNRTPLFEWILGYRFLPWLKTGLSYQSQTGITVRSGPEKSPIPSLLENKSIQYFLSNLSLNSLASKTLIESPWSLIWKNQAFSIYSGFSIGVSWQSWYQSQINSITEGPISLTKEISNHQKIIANFLASFDSGLRMQSAYPNSSYSITLGIKYNYWGQARNIITYRQQDSFKSAQNYLRIQKVYQWSPYLGFQWNFFPVTRQFSNEQINGKSIYRFFPFWTKSHNLQSKIGPWTGLNVAAGFLSFHQVTGNFIVTEDLQTFSIGAGPFQTGISFPMQGNLIYNPSPLYEYLIGYTIIPEIQVAFSFQHQASMRVQTKFFTSPVISLNQALPPFDLQARFSSNLSLDSLMLKTYLHSPWPMIMLGSCTTPYIGGGIGVSWQTWSDQQVLYATSQPAQLGYGSQTIPLKQTFCGNFAVSADLGLKIQSAYPGNHFSFQFGCKYNYWGQALNVGAITRQGSSISGLFKPFRIKTVYQFAPYAGVQWNF